MPAGYEKIRDSYIKRGMSTKRAKKIAAMTWNKAHKGTGQTVGKGRS